MKCRLQLLLVVVHCRARDRARGAVHNSRQRTDSYTYIQIYRSGIITTDLTFATIAGANISHPQCPTHHWSAHSLLVTAVAKERAGLMEHPSMGIITR